MSKDGCNEKEVESASRRLFLGVDVGTGSVRVGLFTENGVRVGIAKKDIKTWTNPGFPEGSFDQSTEDIWQAVCAAIKVNIMQTMRSVRPA